MGRLIGRTGAAAIALRSFTPKAQLPPVVIHVRGESYAQARCGALRRKGHFVVAVREHADCPRCIDSQPMKFSAPSGSGAASPQSGPEPQEGERQ